MDVPGSTRRGVPVREPADHEVAAGVIGGFVGSVVMWLPAMLAVPKGQGLLFPLRLVAATLLGTSALDTGESAGPALVGATLAALMAMLWGLVFVSILPQSTTARSALLAGGAYGAVLFVPSWFGLVRVVDPILYSAGYSLPMFALCVTYGAVLGVQVPLLRKILP